MLAWSQYVPLVKGCYINLVSVYAPTMNATEDKMYYYKTLKNVFLKILQADCHFGHFNARVSRDSHTWSELGKYILKRNSNGILLLQLWRTYKMVAPWFKTMAYTIHYIILYYTCEAMKHSTCALCSCYEECWLLDCSSVSTYQAEQGH